MSIFYTKNYTDITKLCINRLFKQSKYEFLIGLFSIIIGILLIILFLDL